jgi:hypothetical protein
MLIERYKGIAAYVAARIGLPVSEEQVRKWTARRRDPLPAERFVGRVFIRSEALDAWLRRQQRRVGARHDGDGHRG